MPNHAAGTSRGGDSAPVDIGDDSTVAAQCPHALGNVARLSRGTPAVSIGSCTVTVTSPGHTISRPFGIT